MQNDPVSLIRTSVSDQDILDLLNEQYDILENLTETRSYGVSMPDTITYRIEKDGLLIGEAMLKSIRWYNRKAQLSVYLIPEQRGKGLGGQALKILISQAFLEYDLHRVEAEIYEYNVPSLKLVERFGFRQEGRFRDAKYYNGKYFDILFFGLLRSEYR
jgi:RimJ/RimL family protein N-acetyltransferase